MKDISQESINRSIENTGHPLQFNSAVNNASAALEEKNRTIQQLQIKILELESQNAKNGSNSSRQINVCNENSATEMSTPPSSKRKHYLRPSNLFDEGKCKHT